MKKERSPHKYKKTCIDIICDILVKVVLPCIVIGIMLLITFTSHASGEASDLYFPMEQNQNSTLPDTLENILNTNYENVQGFVLKGGETTSWNLYFVVFTENEPLFAEIYSNGYQFSIYSSGTIKYHRIVLKKSDNSLVGINTSGYITGIQGLNSSLYDSSVSYLSNHKIYTANNAKLVLKYGVDDVVIDTGHATPPDEFESPVYTTGHSSPQNVPPTITVNNYSWTTYTPPTVDNSTLEKLLESLTDIVKYNATYLKDNLHNEFTNLVNNIKNLIDYIGQTIQYYGDLIIENIQNLITTFYNNMLSLFEPISTAIDYISQPLDIDSLTDTVNSTQIFVDVDTCITYANDAFGIYGTVSEPNIFKIPLDLRSISLLNITQVYYIDLSWLDGAKSAIRAFMWCIVTFGLLYSVIVDIPNMIRSSK